MKALDFRKTVTSISYERVLDMAAHYATVGYTIVGWHKKKIKCLFWTAGIEYSLVLQLKDTINRPTTLTEQLQSALEREDYREAARIQKLIDKA